MKKVKEVKDCVDFYSCWFVTCFMLHTVLILTMWLYDQLFLLSFLLFCVDWWF